MDPEIIRKAIEDTHKPGNTIVISGRRGGGKTHLAEYLIEYLVDNGWKVLTNILYMRKVKDPMEFEEAYPPNIQKITSMAEMYYFTAQILKKDRQQKIAVVRDEAQNYIVAFRSNSTMEVEMFRAEGDYRKFNILSIYITPTFSYVPKSIREEYVKARWYKPDIGGKRGDFVFEVIGAEPVMVQVPVGKWNKPWDQVKVGEYVYDHMSSASLNLGTVGGREFDITEFRQYYGGRIFSEIPDAILEYFRIKGGIDTLNRNEWDKEDDKRWALECFRRGMSPPEVYSHIDSVTPQTVRAWFRQYNKVSEREASQS